MTKMGLDIEGQDYVEGRKAFERADVRQEQLLAANTESSGAQYENCRGEEEMPHRTRRTGRGGGGIGSAFLIFFFFFFFFFLFFFLLDAPLPRQPQPASQADSERTILADG